MAKRKSNNEKNVAADNFDGVNNTFDADATDNLHKAEHQLINAPVSLEHLVKYRTEFEKILEATEDEISESGYNDMTDAQRQRLLGSGIRRWGFIVKTFEIAGENGEFIPRFMDFEQLRGLVYEISETRNIVISLEQLARIYNDILLVAGNDAYRLALMYYRSVQDAARRGVPGAQAIFRRLEAFFRRGRTTDVAEELPPTKKEALRKAKKLLEGKSDGSIVIEGHARHATAAEHTVIDNTYKPHGTFKETIEGTICSACNTHNAATAKFCNNCGAKL